MYQKKLISSQVFLSPEAPYLIIEKPLEKYSFDNLRKHVYAGSQVELGRVLESNDQYTARMFYYYADGKKISGQINLPSRRDLEGSQGRPVVIMIRGYVDQEIYETGMGTKNGAGYLASSGFITVAPDFLGFGESEMPPNNSLEERFMRPGQILELIASLKNIDGADENRVCIWGHSNGGQIALSVLEISGKKYPTSLWAPVSKPFPYSILYYTDEFDDYGRALRRVVAGFEALYEADDYSIHKYYSWIKAPIQIHQGTNDEAVPLKWSEELKDKLKEAGADAELYVYKEADHNLTGGWDLAMKRSLEFYLKKL